MSGYFAVDRFCLHSVVYVSGREEVSSNAQRLLWGKPGNESLEHQSNTAQVDLPAFHDIVKYIYDRVSIFLHVVT